VVTLSLPGSALAAEGGVGMAGGSNVNRVRQNYDADLVTR